MVEGGDNVKHTVSLQKVQSFVTKCNKVITDAGFQATIGSASLKWSCTKGHWCVGDWWGATGQSFRTVHYYNWMAEGGNTFDPFSSKPSDWGLEDGKVLIGETPSWSDVTVSHGTISVPQQFYLGHKN